MQTAGADLADGLIPSERHLEPWRHGRSTEERSDKQLTPRPLANPGLVTILSSASSTHSEPGFGLGRNYSRIGPGATADLIEQRSQATMCSK